MPFIRSISGLRATLGDGLLPQMIASYASAFAKFTNKGQIVVGRDGRPSGKWIEDIVTGALTASGCEVRLLGVVPTPTVLLEVENSSATGGISITASHNPIEWNGMKFINSEGVFLDKEENLELWNIVDNNLQDLSLEHNFHEKIHDFEAAQRHINSVLNLNIVRKNLEKIKARKFKVAVDAVNSAGSHIIPELLRSLDCEIVDLYCDGSGIFPHTPEPLPQNLHELADIVKAVKADIGIAIDPDADRLVLIDENGMPIGEEKTITLSVQSVISNTSDKGNIVVNLSSSKITELIGKSYGFETHYAPVGEINVVKKMKEVGAIIGGEGSGGVIYPESHYGRDSLVGTALTLSLMAQTGNTLSELSNDLPKLSMVKLKKEFTGSLDKLINSISEKYSSEKITLLDGIRVDFANNDWFQLRVSNTEPIVRVIAEAKDSATATGLANEILEMV